MTGPATTGVAYSRVWQELPTPLSGQARHVTAVPRGRDRIDLFGIGVDDAVWTTAWTRCDGWAPDWSSVVPSGRFDPAGRVAALSPDGVRLDLFAVARDGDADVRTVAWTPDVGWSPQWSALLLGAEVRHVTAAVSGPDRTELFAVGVNSAVWTLVRTAGSGWEPIGSAVRPHGRFGFDQEVTALARRAGGMELFVVDDDASVSTLARAPGADWDPDWTQLPPGAGFDPATQRVAAVAPGSGRLFLFSVGANDAVWCEHSEVEPQWNTEWSTLDGGGTVDHAAQTAAALAPGPDRVAVVALGSDGVLRRIDGHGAGFGGARWAPVPGAPALDPALTRVVATGPAPAGSATGLFAVVEGTDGTSTVWAAVDAC